MADPDNLPIRTVSSSITEILQSEQDTLVGLIKPDNLTDWYRFDEEDTATAIDYGSSGYDLTGTSITTFVEGMVGSAVDLDGTNDYFSLATASMPNIQDDTVGTISLWAKIDADPGGNSEIFTISRNASPIETLISFNYEGVNDRFLLEHKVDNTFQFRAHSGDNSFNQYYDKWVNIVVTQDGVSPKLYLNGIELTLTFLNSTDTTVWFADLFSATNPSDSFTIGGYRFNGAFTNPFDGKVDSFILWDTNLSADEVRRVYEAYDAEPVKKALIIDEKTDTIDTNVDTTLTNLAIVDVVVDAIKAVTDALPTLQETGGTLTGGGAGAEQNVVINNAPTGVFKPIGVSINLDNMIGGDTTIIREYYREKSGGALEPYDYNSYTGVDGGLANGVKSIHITLQPNRYGFKITLDEDAGGTRAYDWEYFYEDVV